MCRSARPRPGRLVGHVTASVAPDGRLAGLEVRPDREEDRPPLLGGGGHDPLERGREPGHRGRDPFAPRALGRHGHGFQAAAVPADPDAPDADDIQGRAALDGQHGRAERQVGRRPEERDGEAATGQVAIADQADGRAVAEGGQELASRLAQADDPHARGTSGPDEPVLEARIVDRLHGCHGVADPRGEVERGELDRAEMETHEDDRSTGRERLADDVGRLDDEPLGQVLPDEPGRPGNLEVVPRAVPEGGSNQPLERPGIARRGPHRRRPAPGGLERRADAGEVPPGLGGPCRGEAVPEVAGQVGQPRQRALRQVAREPGRGDQAARPQRHATASSAAPSASSGGRPRPGPGSRPAPRASRSPAARDRPTRRPSPATSA